ncbi:MAG: cysC [Rhodospirillales bacterium]|nr:cysC [Rhodospirillales bacterium]
MSHDTTLDPGIRGDLPLRIVMVGHVDHGKSTLIGRLLHDADALPEGRVAQVQKSSDARGVGFEWSFVIDALQAERDQGITIETSRLSFATERRRIEIIDAPGHGEFLRNMVTGAASADAAIAVIDVREGAVAQARRHLFLLSLLGVRKVVIAINKMDAVDWDRAAFDRVAGETRAYLAELALKPVAIVPISARGGDNVWTASNAADWHDGSSLRDALDALEPTPATENRPLRLAVQDVYRDGERRIIAGRVESGRVKVGDELAFLPGGQRARVATIEGWNEPVARIAAAAGQTVALTLDQKLFVARGHLAVTAGAAPDAVRRIRVRAFWLAQKPLLQGAELRLRVATADHRVTVVQIERAIDVETLAPVNADTIGSGQIADLVLEANEPMLVDIAADIAATGRGVLVDGHDVAGGCLVLDKLTTRARRAAARRNDLRPPPERLTQARRAEKSGHTGGVLWLTGLSGSGKSTLSLALEEQLFEEGWRAVVLDGDRVRGGLSSDLGFASEDRTENVRRVAETAKLLSDSGLLVIVALISPERGQRADARRIIGDEFREIYVEADLATCAARDPKGLYARAKARKLTGLTGVDSAYEPPLAPELVVDTTSLDGAASLARLADYVRSQFGCRSSTARVIER